MTDYYDEPPAPEWAAQYASIKVDKLPYVQLIAVAQKLYPEESVTDDNAYDLLWNYYFQKGLDIEEGNMADCTHDKEGL